MKIIHPHLCNGCRAPNDVTITKPGVLSPCIAKFKCKNCEAVFVLKVSRPKKTTAHQGNMDITVEVVHYETSKKLQTILRNRESQKAKRSQSNPFDKMG